MAINTQKVIVAGIAAGVVMIVLDFVTQMMLGDRMMADMNAFQPGLGDSMATMSTNVMIGFFVMDLVIGMLLAYTYAAIRPRFGPGPATASIAAFLIFLPVGLELATFAGVFISWELYVRQAALLLVAMIAASIAGAWVYAEEEPDDVRY
jgi:hypothetical protein